MQAERTNEAAEETQVARRSGSTASASLSAARAALGPSWSKIADAAKIISAATFVAPFEPMRARTAFSTASGEKWRR